jgi:hypothetical protein
MQAARALTLSPASGGGSYSSALSTYRSLASSGVDLAGLDSLTRYYPGATPADQAHDPELAGWHQKFGLTSSPSSFSWAKAAGIGGAALGGLYGIYSGVNSGGARGALTASGSALASAGAIMALASKSLSWAGPAGMLAGLGLGAVTSFLPNPKEERAEDIRRRVKYSRYSEASSNTYDYDRYGRETYSTTGGTVRATAAPIVIQVQTLDSKSFNDNAHLVAGALNTALESRSDTRLATNLRSTVLAR